MGSRNVRMALTTCASDVIDAALTRLLQELVQTGENKPKSTPQAILEDSCGAYTCDTATMNASTDSCQNILH